MSLENVNLYLMGEGMIKSLKHQSLVQDIHIYIYIYYTNL